MPVIPKAPADCDRIGKIFTQHSSGRPAIEHPCVDSIRAVRIDSSANGIAIQAAARLLHHLSIIFRDQSPPSNPGGLVNQVDSKLLRKIKAKKIAQGHKEDDYEPTMTL